MLSDEEKAIEELKNKKADYFMISNLTCKTLLNLIEKQSKEIEELKDDLNKKPIFLIKDLYNRKLKEISLQDAKGLIEQGRKELEYKIKAKIEEYENKIKKIRSKKLINEPEDTINITRYVHYISVLQSLLEKE